MSLICPKCKSVDVSKQGFRKLKSGKKQKYKCYDCKHNFVFDDGFKKMRFKSDVVVRAVHQHVDGFSLSKVQNHLWQHEGVKVSRETIRKWVEKYSFFFRKNSSKFRTKN
jgi:transposase-like protein